MYGVGSEDHWDPGLLGGPPLAHLRFWPGSWKDWAPGSSGLNSNWQGNPGQVLETLGSLLGICGPWSTPEEPDSKGANLWALRCRPWGTGRGPGRSRNHWKGEIDGGMGGPTRLGTE